MIPIVPMMFYLAALGLFGLGSLLTRKKSRHLGREGRRERKSIGHFLLITAVLPFGLGVLTQLYSSNPTEIDSSPTSSTGQSRAAPVVPPQSSAFNPASKAPPIIPPPTSSSYDQPPADPVTLLLSQTYQLLEQNQLDAALEKVNAALQAAPQNPIAYGLRANIYGDKKLWDQAEKDYQTAIQLDGKNAKLKFNLAAIEFLQKKYDVARPGFIALEQDQNVGDLATYKVFLCDLFGGHENVAAGELDAFNQVGSNASYYFANAAWSLYHKKTEDARGWLQSAGNIYAPQKFNLYASSLIALGYLPLPPPPQP
jgi:Tfp pilus assembly protein PilF